MNKNGLRSKLARLEKVAAPKERSPMVGFAERLKAARERHQQQGPDYQEEWEKRKDPAYGLDLNSRIGKRFFEIRKKRLETGGGDST